MIERTITISKEKYDSIKKKAEFADNVLAQLESSLEAIQRGKIRKAIH